MCQYNLFKSVRTETNMYYYRLSSLECWRIFRKYHAIYFNFISMLMGFGSLKISVYRKHNEINWNCLYFIRIGDSICCVNSSVYRNQHTQWLHALQTWLVITNFRRETDSHHARLFFFLYLRLLFILRVRTHSFNSNLAPSEFQIIWCFLNNIVGLLRVHPLLLLLSLKVTIYENIYRNSYNIRFVLEVQ